MKHFVILFTMKEAGELLTVRQLQDLLQVDRVTIYRMLKRGVLQGFKVGGQWRFRRDQIEAWLEQQGRRPAPAARVVSPPEGDMDSLSAPLPLSCVLPIQDIFAESLRIGAVTLDAKGAPLTHVSNSCAFCSLILATEEGRRRCVASWQAAAPAEFRPCHAGLLTRSAPVWVEGEQVATVVACQFAAPVEAGQSWQARLARLAEDLGLDQAHLEAAAARIPGATGEDLQRVAKLLHQVAQTFGEIGEERRNLVTRLQRIAEISHL